MQSISPDTGQQGDALVRKGESITLIHVSGEADTGFALFFSLFMKNFIFAQRASVRALAVASAAACISFATSSFAQTAPEAQLKPVIVTADRLPGTPQEQIAGVSVITAQEIANSGVSSINEALIRLLGVVGRQDFYGGGNYALDLRGFGGTSDSNQVIILDGIRLNEADLSSPILAGIAIDSVEKVEVIRGSGAVLFGQGATGGVIVITTKAGKGSPRKTSGQLYAGLGTNGLRDVRAGAVYAQGGFQLDANAQKRDSDNHRDNFRSETNNHAASVQWAGEAVRLGLRLAQDRLKTQLPGSLTAAQYANNPKQSNNTTNKAAINNDTQSLFAQLQLGDWLLNADLGWRGKELRSLSGGSPYEYDVDGHNQSLRAMHNLANAQLANSLSLGFERAAWDREVLGAFGSTASQRSRSFYLRDELTWKATGTRLSAGVRKEATQQDESGSALSPRTSNNAWELGIKQSVNASTSVYGRIGNSFRLANVDEFSFTQPGTTLKPQTSRDLELGAQYLTGALKTDLRWYRSALKNEIGFDPTAPNTNSFSGFGANVNFDDTRRSGLELDGRYEVSPQLALQLNAAWRKAQFTAGAFAGKSVALVPNRTLSLRADWTPAAGHRLSGGVRVVSSQAPDFANLCRIPAFETVDLRYSMQWKSAEFSLGVANLFDRKFYTQAFRCNAGVTTAIYPEAGREINAAVKIAF